MNVVRRGDGVWLFVVGVGSSVKRWVTTWDGWVGEERLQRDRHNGAGVELP
jgi:hypothetical protein